MTITKSSPGSNIVAYHLLSRLTALSWVWDQVPKPSTDRMLPEKTPKLFDSKSRACLPARVCSTRPSKYPLSLTCQTFSFLHQSSFFRFLLLRSKQVLDNGLTVLYGRIDETSLDQNIPKIMKLEQFRAEDWSVDSQWDQLYYQVFNMVLASIIVYQ